MGLTIPLVRFLLSAGVCIAEALRLDRRDWRAGADDRGRQGRQGAAGDDNRALPRGDRGLLGDQPHVAPLQQDMLNWLDGLNDYHRTQLLEALFDG